MTPKVTTKYELFAAIQRWAEARSCYAIHDGRTEARMVEEAEETMLSFLDRFDAPMCEDVFGTAKPSAIGAPYIPAIVDTAMFVQEMPNLRKSAVRFFREGWGWKDVTERLMSVCLHNGTPSSMFNAIVDIYQSTYACVLTQTPPEGSEG
jgi:hypothetical protein